MIPHTSVTLCNWLAFLQSVTHFTNLGSQEGTSNIPPTWVYKKAPPTFHQLECTRRHLQHSTNLSVRTRRQLQHHQLGLTRRRLQLIALQCIEELRAEYKVEISVFNPCMFCMGWWNCRNSTTAYDYRGDACNYQQQFAIYVLLHYNQPQTVLIPFSLQSGCLLFHNHCPFSLSVTRVTILWLNQLPNHFCSGARLADNPCKESMRPTRKEHMQSCWAQRKQQWRT